MAIRFVSGCLLALAAGSVAAAGDCIKDAYGNVVCGKGQCATDQYGKVKCFDACQPATPQLCEAPR